MFLKRNFIIILALIFCFCHAAYGAVYSAEKKSPVGSLVSWKGKVLIYREGEKAAIKVKRMEGVYVNDVIVTEAGSKAKILLKDDTILSLGSNASIKVKAYVLDAKKKTRSAFFKVVSGSVRSLVTGVFGIKNSIFKIETQTSIVGVKGTDFIVASPGEVVALSGEVTVRNASPGIDGEVVLTKGLTTVVRGGLPPAEPTEATKERIEDLIEETSIPVTQTIDIMQGGCIGCHEDTFAAVALSPYQHSDTEKQCVLCHIKEYISEKSIQFGLYSADNIAFLDLREDIPYMVKVAVTDKAGARAESKLIEFTPSRAGKFQTNDKNAPAVEGLRMEEIKKGVFYSVVFAWETDKPSLTVIEYGDSTSYGKTAAGAAYYTTAHTLMLDNLVPDETYYARAVSEDVFGRRAASEPLKLKLKKAEAEKAPESGALNPEVFDIAVFKIGEKTALRWRTNKKTSAIVTLSEGVSAERLISEDPHYPGFKHLIESGMRVCEDCHKGKIHRRSTHSIGNVAWENASKPRDLPLGLRGEIMCATCHGHHGGKVEYILRKEQTELCKSCHVDKR